MSEIVHVSINKVPSSIKTTHFYNILKDKYIKRGRDVDIPIPADLYAKELVISTLYDMIPTLESLFQFTGDIDEKNYDFVYENRDIIRPHIESVQKTYPNSTFLDEIVLLITHTNTSMLLYEIIENDYVNLLKYCLSKELIFVDYENICVLLAKKGKYECLKYMYSIGATVDKQVLDMAIKFNHEECVNYIVFYTNVE